MVLFQYGDDVVERISSSFGVGGACFCHVEWKRSTFLLSWLETVVAAWYKNV
jgi:hypothetical protein